MIIQPLKEFKRIITPPPDKSIMQRAVILGAMKGGIEIDNPSLCGDCLSAIECVRALGADIEYSGGKMKIAALNPPKKRVRLNAGNSATAMRLLLGLAAGMGLEIEISGDESLSRRNMRDTVLALTAMGARIEHSDYRAPLINYPAELRKIDFMPESPSAQVKSAVLLAAENAKGQTRVCEKIKTRDHTERLLKHINDGAKSVWIPGDISAAAYPIALAVLTRGGEVSIKNVGLNPLRLGMVNVLKAAGAHIEIRTADAAGFEPFGDIVASYSPDMTGFCIDGSILPSLIDEVPVLAVIACFCRGESVFRNLKPLRNKESDRLTEILACLSAFGASVRAEDDSIIIKRNTFDFSPVIDSVDHRIVMSAAVAGATAAGCEILYPECVCVSYPKFFEQCL